MDRNFLKTFDIDSLELRTRESLDTSNDPRPFVFDEKENLHERTATKTTRRDSITRIASFHESLLREIFDRYKLVKIALSISIARRPPLYSMFHR